MRRAPGLSVGWITLFYMGVSAVWIFLLDERLDGWAAGHGWLEQTEDLVFLSLTGSFLYVQLRYRDRQWQRAEQRFAEMAESIQEVFWLADLNTGRLLYVSPAYESIWQRSCESLMARPSEWLEAVHPADRARVHQALITDEPLGRYDEEYRVLRPDGSIRWIRDRGFPVRDESGKITRNAGVARDITESKLRAQEADEMDERLRMALRASRTGVWEWDLATNQVFWSPESFEITGVEKMETLADFEALVHPEDAPSLWEKIEGALAGTHALELEFRIVNPAGQTMWLASSGTVRRDGEGKPLKILGTATDITARRESEEARTRLEACLREAQKMEAVGQLAGGVAHDFNNLLTVIEGNATLLWRMAIPTEGVALTSEILQAVRRAALLTQQLLMFSRKKAMDRQLVSLSEVTEHVLRMLARVLGEDVQVVTHLAPSLPLAMVDEVMLEQVIMNLALNARDAMPNGGTLTLTTRAEGDWVCLLVSDTGCGIPSENLAHIFEPFFTTKDVGRGTGLGLATVYGIVQQHEGTVSVESAPGRGTTFRVCLPGRPGELSSSPSAPSVALPEFGHETILLVEDDPALRRLAERILTASGYQVVGAGTGQDALAEWGTHRSEIDLVLSDLVMPGGMTGLQLCDRLRQDQPDLKVLFTSGYSEELLDRRCASPSSGAMFLTKPYSPQRLTEAVRRCLDASALPPSA